jgi:hypothetical protein
VAEGCLSVFAMCCSHERTPVDEALSRGAQEVVNLINTFQEAANAPGKTLGDNVLEGVADEMEEDDS